MLADHIQFDMLTRPQRRIVGQHRLLCSPRRRGPRARAKVRQRELAQTEAAQGFIQWLDNYKRLVYDTQPDTDPCEKCWIGTATAACTGVRLPSSVPDRPE